MLDYCLCTTATVPMHGIARSQALKSLAQSLSKAPNKTRKCEASSRTAAARHVRYFHEFLALIARGNVHEATAIPGQKTHCSTAAGHATPKTKTKKFTLLTSLGKSGLNEAQCPLVYTYYFANGTHANPP